LRLLESRPNQLLWRPGNVSPTNEVAALPKARQFYSVCPSETPRSQLAPPRCRTRPDHRPPAPPTARTSSKTGRAGRADPLRRSALNAALTMTTSDPREL